MCFAKQKCVLQNTNVFCQTKHIFVLNQNTYVFCHTPDNCYHICTYCHAIISKYYERWPPPTSAAALSATVGSMWLQENMESRQFCFCCALIAPAPSPPPNPVLPLESGARLNSRDERERWFLSSVVTSKYCMYSLRYLSLGCDYSQQITDKRRNLRRWQSFFPSHTVLCVFVAKKSDFFRPLDK
jgi:hypothetical protein